MRPEDPVGLAPPPTAVVHDLYEQIMFALGEAGWVNRAGERVTDAPLASACKKMAATNWITVRLRGSVALAQSTC